MKKKTIAILLVVTYFLIVTYAYFAPLNMERYGQNADKAFHFLVFFCGGIVFIIFNLLKVSRRYSVILLISLFIAPFLLELTQDFVSYRVYDPLDMLYNYTGLVTTLIPFGIYLIVRKVILD